jgi:hypothetical protein
MPRRPAHPGHISELELRRAPVPPAKPKPRLALQAAIIGAMRLRVPQRANRTALPEVDTFDEVPGATVTDVALPRDPAPAPRSQSVQSIVPEGLVGNPKTATFPLRVAVLSGASLATMSGAVITARGDLVRETLWDDDHWRRSFSPPPHLAEPTRVAGRHASILSLWCHNFFHWLFEALPRLAVLEASGVNFERLIVPERLAPFQLETLELLGFGRDRLLPFSHEHVLPDELVWASPLAPIGYPTPFLVRWLRRRFGAPEGGGTRRVYVRRDSRTVVNESELLPILNRRGFEVIDPGALSFREQISLFGSTAVAVGPHGAAFANATFAQHLVGVEFYQPEHLNLSITGVFAASGHDHWSILGTRVKGVRRRAHQNMRVSARELEATLERVLPPT